MPDHAVSTDPAVQAQLDRLWRLSPGADILGLDRIARLCDRLGNPERALPPVFHVAGTNGKGSTCAYLRAAIEAAGMSAHVFTSPHLIRFNERIRIAGSLIEDAALAALLAEVLDVAEGIGASFFEVTTAAAFLAFSRTPADACIVEVGLGGRLDATNVIADPLVCGIAQLGLDHQSFLGDTIEAIAAEKAGIAKPGVPILTLHYPATVANEIGRAVREAGAEWHVKGGSWDAAAYQGRLHYRDAQGKLDLPLPGLAGQHQAMNAALAVAMLRHQDAIAIPASALRAAMGWADWPARLQHLRGGALLDRLPPGSDLWIDGGHNPSAGRVIGDFLRGHVAPDRPLHIVLGLLANKDAGGFLAAMGRVPAHFHMVPVPGHEHHAPAALADTARLAGFAADAATGFEDALAAIAAGAGDVPPMVLVGGSLYLAGKALEANGTVID
ncbi:bifunctional folylpolyglutamate synthase/dihydrofolate synthase [Sphingomonas histidinilytica]|uniref:bifunctional folylpolyglutamate synthase/dihydrofolate synthase n=1 Tax=Rhizorhabdus histidinilytica TaxID=439228 RepID=UPI001ADAD832|nr:folylpolyglutamate synthase/dihydrofolate synthase family protein [Rhizorhabdus histidinilytica]MBO9379730.1 bifunctional folylpolyglutamate synthase/dihydrofolate synthase [Rhizorhabdus histidinilytica]